MPAEQLNVEYFFRLLYNCIRGACYDSVGATQFSAWVAYLWTKIVVIGYILSIIGFLIIMRKNFMGTLFLGKRELNLEIFQL